MATRVGKYKLSKKETALHQNNTGDITYSSSKIRLTGLGTVSQSIGAKVGANFLFTTQSSYFSSSKIDANKGGFNVICSTS